MNYSSFLLFTDEPFIFTFDRFKELLDTTEPPERIFLNFKRKYFLLMGRKPFK